jgi:hypothetical protein
VDAERRPLQLLQGGRGERRRAAARLLQHQLREDRVRVQGAERGRLDRETVSGRDLNVDERAASRLGADDGLEARGDGTGPLPTTRRAGQPAPARDRVVRGPRSRGCSGRRAAPSPGRATTRSTCAGSRRTRAQWRR